MTDQPKVIEVEGVKYVRVDALPKPVELDNYIPGANRWMAQGHNEYAEEVRRIVGGVRYE